MPDDAWLTSAQVRELLKISTCDLAHLRQGGRLRFQKQGNAYLYSSVDCENFSQGTEKSASGKCSIDRQDR